MDYYKLNAKGEVVKMTKKEKKTIDEQAIAFSITIVCMVVMAITIAIGYIQAEKIINNKVEVVNEIR